MIIRLTFRPEVPADLASAASWYHHQRAGLGEEFLSEYRLALDALVKRPLLRPEDQSGMRFWLVKRFPYRIFYRVQDDNIVVAAVFHVRRNPARLKDRGS